MPLNQTAAYSNLICCYLAQKTVRIESDWNLDQVILRANELIFQNIPWTYSFTSSTASKLIKRALKLHTHLKKVVGANVTNFSYLASYFALYLKPTHAYSEFCQDHIHHVLGIFFILYI